MSTWWIDEPIVMGSSNPTDEDLARLRGQGFSVLISLLHDKKECPKYDVKAAGQAGWRRHSIPIEDFNPPSLDQLRNFVRVVGTGEQGTKMLLHCQGGAGRTGTMAAAYWIAKGLSASAAIERVREARPGAIETCEQELVLYQYAEVVGVGPKKNGSA